jgi:hypothetical protein
MYHNFFEANVESYHDLKGSEFADFMRIFGVTDFTIGVYFRLIIGDIYDNKLSLTSSKEDLELCKCVMNTYIERCYWTIQDERNVVIDDIRLSDDENFIDVELKDALNFHRYTISLEVTPEHTVNHIKITYERLAVSSIMDEVIIPQIEEAGWTYIGDNLVFEPNDTNDEFIESLKKMAIDGTGVPESMI